MHNKGMVLTRENRSGRHHELTEIPSSASSKRKKFYWAEFHFLHHEMKSLTIQ